MVNRRQGKAKSTQTTTPVAARGILTRVNPEGLKALRQLALDRDTTDQALMIEAANDLLRKYKRRSVAVGRQTTVASVAIDQYRDKLVLSWSLSDLFDHIVRGMRLQIGASSGSITRVHCRGWPARSQMQQPAKGLRLLARCRNQTFRSPWQSEPRPTLRALCGCQLSEKRLHHSYHKHGPAAAPRPHAAAA
jgi:hypothetical protein